MTRLGNKDRVGIYFKKYMETYLFDEFSASYIERLENGDFLKGVMVPLYKKGQKAFWEGEALSPEYIADNMLCVMGGDSDFPYLSQYKEYIGRFLGPEFSQTAVKLAQDLVRKEQWEEAALRLRGILQLDPENEDAIYVYARVLRDLYLSGEDPDYIGRCKAESIHWFEVLTELCPSASQPYYYLGYGYLNLGLYTKADLVWQEYLRLSTDTEECREIRERREQLKEPMQIEKGINCVLSGRFEEAARILLPFTDTEFGTWWPLFYHLGIAYARLGQEKSAIDHFRKGLALNPSHVETMIELADLYALKNDRENESKYRKKAEILLAQQEMNETADNKGE